MFDEQDTTKIKELINEAISAREYAYAKFSNFMVGAAILGENGKIYRGCNVENSSYPATNCAERTAVFSGIADGCKNFSAIAMVGGKENEELDYCYPCGICRQVLYEFADSEKFYVIVAKSTTTYKIYTLDELLPHGFKL